MDQLLSQNQREKDVLGPEDDVVDGKGEVFHFQQTREGGTLVNGDRAGTISCQGSNHSPKGGENIPVSKPKGSAQSQLLLDVHLQLPKLDGRIYRHVKVKHG